MSILVNKETKLLVQGITGKEGQFHARACIDYGTQVVAGVTPGKGGQKMDDVPVFNTVKDAVARMGEHRCGSIVVIESIELKRRQGLDRLRAAVEGVQSVWPAVLASTATTIPRRTASSRFSATPGPTPPRASWISTTTSMTAGKEGGVAMRGSLRVAAGNVTAVCAR